MRLPHLLLRLLLVALLLLAAGCGDEPDPLGAAQAAERAARDAVVEMTTYDHTSVDEDFAWVDDAGTAKFREQYAEASAPVKQAVIAAEARAKGVVVEAAPDYVDDTHVTVLLFVDQTITNARAGDQANFDQLRVKMKMELEGGRWLVDEVEVVNRSTGGPG